MSIHPEKRQMVFIHSVSRRRYVPQDRSPLLALPGEIRNLIYETVLTDPVRSVFDYELKYGPKVWGDGSVSENYETQGPPRHLHRPSSAPLRLAILQTCRQIYREAYQIYYACHTFEFRYTEDLRLFLKEVGKRRRREITSLGIDISDISDVRRPAVISLLRECVKLRHLQLVCGSSFPQYPDSRHILCLRALGGLRGLERVEIYSGCWLRKPRGVDMKGKSCDWPYCPWCKLDLEELKVEVEETMTRPHERKRLEALRISSKVQRVEELGRAKRPGQLHPVGKVFCGNMTARNDM